LFSWFLWGFRFAVHETPVLFAAFVDAPFRFAYFHPWDNSQGYYLLHFQRKESKRCHSHGGGNLFAKRDTDFFFVEMTTKNFLIFSKCKKDVRLF
jgi:hypothetical protein